MCCFAARISALPPSVVESILNLASNELKKGGDEAINIIQTFVVFHERSEHAGATVAWLHANAQGLEQCDTDGGNAPSCELCGDYDDECQQRRTVVFADLRLHRIHEVLPHDPYVRHLIFPTLRSAECRVCLACHEILY